MGTATLRAKRGGGAEHRFEHRSLPVHDLPQPMQPAGAIISAAAAFMQDSVDYERHGKL
jgi:hypothetical protein